MDVGLTVHVPDAVEVENVPGVIVIVPMVPVAFHDKVDVPADMTVDGVAINDDIAGGVMLLTVTVTDAVELLLARS